VWDPHTQANINKVESIQRRAARFVTNNYDPRASVTTLLQDLNWSATLHLQLKIKTFQKCTNKNKEVEIMEGWCLSGYDGRCQWSLS
jgi:hypothetical protein